MMTEEMDQIIALFAQRFKKRVRRHPGLKTCERPAKSAKALFKLSMICLQEGKNRFKLRNILQQERKHHFLFKTKPGGNACFE